MDLCQTRGATCLRALELIPVTSASIRLRSTLTGFNDAYCQGDLTLAENRALLLERNVPSERRLAQLMHALVQATQGHYYEARQRFLSVLSQQTHLDDTDESALWYTIVLDYVMGDWVSFEEHTARYLEAPQINGCVCLRQMRVVMAHALIALREQVYSVALANFQGMAAYQHLFPITATWGRLGMFETRLRMGNRLIAQHEMRVYNEFVEQHHAKPVAGWQLLFPQVFREAKTLGYDWQTVDMPMPITTPHQVYPETAACRIELFGRGRVQWRGQEITQFNDHLDARQLLAYLVLKTTGATGQEILIDLWPERYDEGQADTLTHLLNEIATWTPEPIINYHSGVYYARPDLWVDVLAYTESYNQARSTRDLPALHQVQRLYTAPFLHGVAGIWAEEMRARFQLMQSWLLWHISSIYRDERNYNAAQQLLEASVDSNYTFDRGVNDLMRLLEEMGLRGEAIRRYETYRKRIKSIYGIEPAPHLQQLAHRLRGEELQITGAFQASDLQRAIRATMPVLNKDAREPDGAPERARQTGLYAGHLHLVQPHQPK